MAFAIFTDIWVLLGSHVFGLPTSNRRRVAVVEKRSDQGVIRNGKYSVRIDTVDDRPCFVATEDQRARAMLLQHACKCNKKNFKRVLSGGSFTTVFFFLAQISQKELQCGARQARTWVDLRPFSTYRCIGLVSSSAKVSYERRILRL